MSHPKAKKAAKRVRASDLPKIEQLPGRLDFDATICLREFQAYQLAGRFGLPLARAALVASLAWAARK